MNKTWKLYILRCGDGSLYTGIAVDVQARLEAHRSGKGAKYTRGRGPLELVYTEECGDHSAALRREIQIKKLTREQKDAFLQDPTLFLPEQTICVTKTASNDMIEKKGGTAMRKSLLIHPEELNKKWIDRMVDLEIDTLALHPVGGRIAHQTLADLLERAKTKEFRDLADYACSRGLKLEYEVHAGSWLLPREEFEAHPDWRRVDTDGIRNPKGNFCVSQPDALEYVCNRAAELAEGLYRSENSYYFWLDDGKDLRCHCEKCSKLSASDQQLLVMNGIVRRLREKDPEAKLAYLGYYACMEVPKQVKPKAGIFLEYAPIDRKFDRPVSQQLGESAKMLLALRDFFGTENAKVLEYWYDNSLFSKWTKPPKAFVPDNDLIREDVAYYHSLGFDYISSFACYLGEDYEELYGEPDISAFQK